MMEPLFLERLQNAFDAGALRFFNELAHLAEPASFHALAAHCAAPLGSSTPRSLSAKPPKYSPISGATPIASPSPRIQDCDGDHIAFAWKDYRDGGAVKTTCLKPDEFIRRFLLHGLPDGFHRIRQFGFLANGRRTQKLALCRSLLTSGCEPTTCAR
jgi:hypothetical protein